jgi:release factor glutamine methyltransferase
MDKNMITYGELISWFQKELGQMYDSREIPSLVSMLAEECWGLSKGQLLLQRDEMISPDRYAELIKVMSELKLGTPLQYILGNAWFFDHRFYVNANVLIPRPETEELVEWVVGRRRGDLATGRRDDGQDPVVEPARILDIGTGSGCIAVSLKLKMPEAEVWAMDVSLPALEVARYNAETLGADVKFILGDILNWQNTKLGSFDVIVSNPPYITTNEKTLMRANVLDYEPELALFVHDSDPLVFYKAIADFSLHHLNEGGMLFFEINEAFGKEVVELLESKGYHNLTLRRDMMGKDRMVMGRFQN